MRNKALFLNLGKEEAEVPLEEVEVIEPMDEASNLELDAHEDSVELADDEQLVDDAIDATESVGELNVATEAAIASGKGLNRIEAAALNMALKAAVGKYVQVEGNIVPAHEAYDVGSVNGESSNTATDAQNTETSKEANKGLKATAKAFIDSIIAKLKALAKKIINMLKSVTDRINQNHKRLKSLAKRLETLPDFKDKTITLNSLNLHTGANFDIPSITEGVEETAKIVQAMYSSTRSVEEHNFLMEGMSAIKSSDLSKWEQLKNSLNAHTVTFYKSMVPTAKKEGEIFVSPTLPGGRQLVLNPGEENGQRQLATIQLKRTQGQGETKQSLTIPNKENIANLIDEALVLLAKASAANDKSATRRAEADFESVISSLKQNPKEDARLAGNKEQLSSLMNLTSSGASLRYWLWDLAFVVVSGVYELANKAFEIGKEKVEKEEKQTA